MLAFNLVPKYFAISILKYTIAKGSVKMGSYSSSVKVSVTFFQKVMFSHNMKFMTKKIHFTRD